MLAHRDLGGGRFALGDAHGDFIEAEEITQADRDAARRELEKREHQMAARRTNAKRRAPVMGVYVSSKVTRSGLKMLMERGFSKTELCELLPMASKRFYDILNGKQLRVRQGTQDNVEKLLLASMRGEIEPRNKTKRSNRF